MQVKTSSKLIFSLGYRADLSERKSGFTLISQQSG